MRLKSEQSTNQRFITCVTTTAVCLMICLLTTEVLAAYAASSKQHQIHSRFARQLPDEDDKTKVNCAADCSVTNSYHQPHFTGNRSVIVQLFEWKFVDIAEECRTFLGPQGYAGVQLSPVLEHTIVKSSNLNHPWWERYEIISYRLASRSGDESEFWSMSRICNDNGIRIYADVILNHMATPELANTDFIVNTSLEINVNISNLNYPNVSYTHQDFHRPCAIENTQDAHEIRNCQLNGHPDLDHSRAAVQQHIVEMLNKFIDMGVAGFRVDTAKHIWPIDLKKIFQQVKDLSQEFNFVQNARPFVYHDVFDIGLDTASKTEYTTYGVVSEYLYPAELSTILNGKAPLSSLINWGPAMGFLAHQDSLVFVDSHDTQRGLPNELGHNHMLTYTQRIKYIMANAFMLAHPYGNIKRIMSSYYYAANDVNQGPPVEEEDDEDGDVIRSPKFNAQQQCTVESGWVCEHRWSPVVNMVKMANYFRVRGQEEERVMHFQTNGPNHIAFCRGEKAFVAMNNDPEMDFSKEVYTCLEPGIYCDIITGGVKEGEQDCHGRRLEVNEKGYAQLVLPVADGHGEDYRDVQNNIDEVGEEEEEEPNKIESYGVLVVYVGSQIQLVDSNDIETYQNPTEDPLTVEENDIEDNEDVEVIKEDENNTIVDDDQSKPDQPREDIDSPAEINPEESEDNLKPKKHDNDVDNDIETSEDQPEDSADQVLTTEENIENRSDNPENNMEETEGQPGDEKLYSSATADQPETENEADAESALENDANDGDNEVEENEGEALALSQAKEEDANGQDLEEDIPEQNEEQQEDQEESPGKVAAEEIADIQKNIPEEEEEQTALEEVPAVAETEISEEANEDNAAENPAHNQPENIDEIETEMEHTPEEQIEKPSADIVDDLTKEAKDSSATVKIPDIQKAGIFSTKSQKANHNG